MTSSTVNDYVIEQTSSPSKDNTSPVPSDPVEVNGDYSSGDDSDDDDTERISIDHDLLLKTHQRAKKMDDPNSQLLAKSVFSGLLCFATGLCVSLIGPTLPDLQYLTGAYSLSQTLIVVSASSVGIISGILAGDCLFRWLSPRKVLSFSLTASGFLLTFIPYCNGLNKCCTLMILQGIFLGLVEKGVFSMFHSWRSQRFMLTILYFSFAFGSSLSPFIASQFVYHQRQIDAANLTSMATLKPSLSSRVSVVRRSAEAFLSATSLPHNGSDIGQPFGDANHSTVIPCYNDNCTTMIAATTKKITKPKVADGAALSAETSYANRKMTALKLSEQKTKNLVPKEPENNKTGEAKNHVKYETANETFTKPENLTANNITSVMSPTAASAVTTTYASTTTTISVTLTTSQSSLTSSVIPTTVARTASQASSSISSGTISFEFSSSSLAPVTHDHSVLEKLHYRLWAFVMWAVSRFNNAYMSYMVVSLLTVALAFLTFTICCCKGLGLNAGQPTGDLVLSGLEFTQFRAHQCTLVFIVLLAMFVSGIEALASSLLTVYTIVGLGDSQYTGAVLTGTFFLSVAAARLLLIPLIKYSTRIIAVNLALLLVFAGVLVFSAELMSFWLEVTAVGLVIGSLLPNIFCWLHDQVALVPCFTTVWLISCHVGWLVAPVSVITVMESHSFRDLKLAILVLALLACLSFIALNRIAKQSSRLSLARHLAFEMNGNANQFLSEFSLSDKLDDIFNDHDEFLYFDRARDLKIVH
ncbi:unnamed protein product [Soboliphyme baturini]|uniref:MFS domain-containing protein n=1 Tax=Soboliphyme baturini TaxID=241478 RepID=A0A183IKQ0_9BILA|nr:unnamed protein product [Soboliphyme baturini]